MSTLHRGLTLATLAAIALALGIELLAWPALVGGSIASIWAFALLLQDAFEVRPVQPMIRLSRACTDKGRALPSTSQPAS